MRRKSGNLKAALGIRRLVLRATGVMPMATKAQAHFQPQPEPGKRELAHRSGHDVSGPLTVILALIAFVLLASFVYSLDWNYTSEFPAVSQTAPSPHVNATVPPAPANPPSHS